MEVGIASLSDVGAETTDVGRRTRDIVRYAVLADELGLHLLSQGRAEIGVGRSAHPDPFTLFGVDLANYDEGPAHAGSARRRPHPRPR